MISLVIATYNRAGLLRRTLPALAAQQTDVRYEVLFVDDGSTDESPRLIEAAARHSDVFRYMRIRHTGSPARPRNIGIQEAQGDIVVLMDDDVMPDVDFVGQHARFHHRLPSDAEAALGELYLSDDVRSDPMSLFHSFPYDEAARHHALSYLFFWTCNVSLKTSFLRRVGTFDEDSALHPLEDMEYGFRLAQAGMRLRFLPAARGCHLHQLQVEAVAAKGRRTGRAQSALVRKVPDLALQRRFGIRTAHQPLPLQVLRIARRAAFRVVDNPLTRVALRRLGAAGGERSRMSDFYYYLAFRRAVVAGFNEAEAERR